MILDYLKQAVDQNASDLFLIPGMPASLKINGEICPVGENKFFPDTMDALISEIYELSGNRPMEQVCAHGDDDFSFSVPGLSRFRASVMKQRGSLAAIIDRKSVV